MKSSLKDKQLKINNLFAPLKNTGLHCTKAQKFPILFVSICPEVPAGSFWHLLQRTGWFRRERVFLNEGGGA